MDDDGYTKILDAIDKLTNDGIVPRVDGKKSKKYQRSRVLASPIPKNWKRYGG